MPQKELNVGDIIESQCRKCSDRTGHAIVAMVDGQVAKVECKACGSVHKHYSPKEASKTTKTKSASGSGSAAGKGSKKEKASQAKEKKEKIDEEWLKQIENKDQSKAVAYSMQGCYNQEDLLEHPHFGLGIVQKVIMPNKMDVLFREGTKRLRCDLTEQEPSDQA